MIIMGLLEIVTNILLFIFSFLPDDYPRMIDTAVNVLTASIVDGVGILAFYFRPGTLGIVFSFAIELILAVYVIKLVKYIIKLIPVLNMNTDSSK